MLLVVNIQNLKNLKYHIFKKKTLILCVIFNNCGSKNEKIFKEQELIEKLNILT